MKIQAIWEQMGTRWSCNPGVEDLAQLEEIERGLNQKLPADYKWFLQRTNGGETLAPLPRVRLYPADELLERRSDGQPPGTIEFGTDDSDGFAFDLSVNRDNAKYPVLKYPLGSTDRQEAETISSDFVEFLGGVATNRI